MIKWLRILSLLLCLEYIPTGLANVELASIPVGFIIKTWNTIFGFELTNLLITSGDGYTYVFSQLPTHVSEPDYSTYEADPTPAFIPIAITTKGTKINGTLLISYTIQMTLPRVSWTGSTVFATNIPLIIQGGQLQDNPNATTTIGDTTCKLTPLFQNQKQYIELYCWLSSPEIEALK